MTTSTKSPKSARQVLVGIPASPGYVMGRAFQVASREITVVEESIPKSRIAAEEEKFRKAITRTSKEISQIKEISETRTGVHDSLIFATHLMILQDPGLVNGTLNLIRKERKSARWALHVVLGGYIDNFEKIDSPAMRDKAADLRDLHNRLMAAMEDTEPALEEVSAEDGAVIVAHEVLPSFLMALKPGQARALLMDTGGRTSHVAILARSLQIPVVSGLRNVAAVVKTNDTLIVDGSGGLVIVNPNEDDIRKFHERQEVYERQRRELFTMRRLEPMTRDGKYITLHANVELPNEAAKVMDYGATGVGLYRSEFLFLQYVSPTEEEQTEIYRKRKKTIMQ